MLTIFNQAALQAWRPVSVAAGCMRAVRAASQEALPHDDDAG